MRHSPVPGPDQNGYYIRKRFYTEENIQAGREFYSINCAVCHGQEADGTGIRAEIMTEAKPRMLTNLDWQNTHDDLYMLRSIKYGVPGTAMTPWGDFTSSLQRMQLVIFIRSLTEETERRGQLATALFQAFDAAQMTIENARIEEYTNIDTTQKQYGETKRELEKIKDDIVTGKATPEQASVIFKKEFDLLAQLQKQKEKDNKYTDLKGSVKKEFDLYQEIGKALINRQVDEETFNDFLNLIKISGENRFSIKEKHLTISPAPEKEIAAIGQKIINMLNTTIANLSKENHLEEGKIQTPAIAKKAAHLTSEIRDYTKLRNLIVSNLQEAVREREKEAKNIIGE